MSPLSRPAWLERLRPRLGPQESATGPESDSPEELLEGEVALVQPGWPPPVDLLRERRHRLDLEPMSGVLVQRPELIGTGLLIGGLIVGASAGLCVLLLIWHQLLNARMVELKGIEQEVERLNASVAAEQASLNTLRGSNDRLVKRLSDVRSSSALLAELQRRVPEGVQITKVQMVSPTELQLEGLARDPMGFGRVNAMELVLRRSPLVKATGVALGKVERKVRRVVEIKRYDQLRGANPVIAKLLLPSAVRFQMTATLAPLEAKELLAVSDELKADGMASRLRKMQREGLLP
jgi:type IV pilus assembly protein PilN